MAGFGTMATSAPSPIYGIRISPPTPVAPARVPLNGTGTNPALPVHRVSPISGGQIASMQSYGGITGTSGASVIPVQPGTAGYPTPGSGPAGVPPSIVSTQGTDTSNVVGYGVATGMGSNWLIWVALAVVAILALRRGGGE